MSRRRSLRVLVLTVLTLAVVASLLGSVAIAEPAQPSARAVSRLQARSSSPLRAHYHPRYGNVDFLMGRGLYSPSAAARGDALATALEFLGQHRDLYQMADPARELALVRTTADRLGQSHVRLAQQHNGVPVFGRSLYVHLDAAGDVLGTNGDYVPGLQLNTTPSIGAGSAEQLAVRELGAPAAAPRAPARLVVYLDTSAVAHLAWLVEVYDADAPARAYVFVDARGGRILHSIDMLMTAKERVIYDAENEEQIPGVEVGREGEVPRDREAKQAYQSSGDVYDYYADVHQRDSYDDRGGEMISTVHFGEGYDNAFWDGAQMVYGDGDVSVTKPYVYGLDVVAHEMSHGVIQYTAGLIYESQSGALNESYADVFGAMVDRDDWQMGEDIWNPDNWPTPYLRDMVDPSLGGFYDVDNPLESFGQPAHMDEYANLPAERRSDNGGVHINSGIPNHAAYLAAEAIGGDEGRQAVEQVWYRTVSTYLTEDSSFEDFRVATLQAAADIFGEGSSEVQAMEEGLTGVGLTGEVGPTPPPTATPRGGRTTPEPQPTPNRTAGCTELVQNPGFEKSQPDPWVEYTALEVPIVTDELAHTGKRSAWLGGSDEEAFHYIYQDIEVPANVKNLTLSYWHYLHEEFAERGGETESQFSVLLANTDGDIIAELEVFSSAEANEDWAQSTISLNKYAGKVVRLAYTADMTQGNISSFFVDDVSLLGCTGDAGPTPQPGGGIEVSGQITDYNTGDGIEGATVFVLDPAITASEAADDGRVTRDEVFSMGVTDRSGYFTLDTPLARDTVYSAIVIADGYYAIIADEAIDTTDWPDVVDDLNGEMQPAD
jgi:bacillolysin/thermolysin/neutral peptidase B